MNERDLASLTLVHSPRYGEWVFDDTHPTQGRRFIHGATDIAKAIMAAGGTVDIAEPRTAPLWGLESVHSPGYVRDVLLRGISYEWKGTRTDLGELAALMAGGTLVALDVLLGDRSTLTAVNLAGAKHHAGYDYSSGFCVFADLAMAAKHAVKQGYRVAILDIDAHHGDGTEILTRDVPEILTYSVHEQGIFPGTGNESIPEQHVYNKPLKAWSGNRELLDAVHEFNRLAAAHGADIIFVAAGADGHETDPLSSLQYTLDGYEVAGKALRRAFRTTPILIGGAGGYQPDDFTPEVWTRFVKGVAL